MKRFSRAEIFSYIILVAVVCTIWFLFARRDGSTARANSVLASQEPNKPEILPDADALAFTNANLQLANARLDVIRAQENVARAQEFLQKEAQRIAASKNCQPLNQCQVGQFQDSTGKLQIGLLRPPKQK